MPIPTHIHEEAEALLDAYCKDLVPEHARDQVQIAYLVQGMMITLFERRPRFDDPSKWMAHDVARFRFNKTTGVWTLYWLDRNLKWHIYEHAAPTPDFSILLKEVDADPTGIFWG